MIADLLISFFDVTFDHNSLDHLLHIIIVSSAVKNFADNTNLFFELLIGVGMVRINDRCRVFQVFLRINIYQTDKILIMVVRNTGSIFVNTTTKNYMCKIISFCCNIHSSVNEVMRVLSSNYGVHHN